MHNPGAGQLQVFDGAHALDQVGALLFDFLELDHFLVNDFYPLLQILVALLLVLETLTKNEQRYKRDDTAAQQRGQRERADKITASLLASGLSPIQQIN